MLKLSLLIGSLFLFSAYAEESNIFLKSYMCDETVAVDVQGVTCCTDQLSLQSCERLVYEFLPASQLARVQSVKAKILSGAYPYKENPNCHWNALAFYYPQYFNEALPMVDLQTYKSLLENDFVEINETEAQAGDLVVYFEYDIRQREMVEVGGRPRLVWVNLEGELIFHSAVYFSQGIVFQKENLDSSIFSFGALEKVRLTYDDLANQNPSQRRSKVKYRVYRKMVSLN